MGPVPQPLLHLRPAVPLARLEWPHRDGRLHLHPGGRAVLRVAQTGPAVVLSSPRPTIELARVAADLAAALASRARVSTLHDMVVIDVDRERLVEVATLVRDDPRTRCDLYSVNAGVDMGAELRSVTFVRGTTTHVFVMLRTTCPEMDPHVPTLA